MADPQEVTGHDYSPHNGKCRRCGHYDRAHDGIADYYARKDAEYKAEYDAWAAQDPETRGSFEPVTYFD